MSSQDDCFANVSEIEDTAFLTITEITYDKRAGASLQKFCNESSEHYCIRVIVILNN